VLHYAIWDFIIAPLVDPDLHRLNIYLRFLIKKIEIYGTDPVDLTDKVMLQYYKLENQGKVRLMLNWNLPTRLS
jgi:type I restriction enzyme R subunit